MKREIKVGNKVFAVIIDLADAPSGAHPATDAAWPLQLLTMNRESGHVVPKHMHKRLIRTSNQPQEALVVIRGAVRAVIYDRKGKVVGRCNITAGQCLILADGGHEVAFTKDTLAYEFKTGPYMDDKIKL